MGYKKLLFRRNLIDSVPHHDWLNLLLCDRIYALIGSNASCLRLYPSFSNRPNLFTERLTWCLILLDGDMPHRLYRNVNSSAQSATSSEAQLADEEFLTGRIGRTLSPRRRRRTSFSRQPARSPPSRASPLIKPERDDHEQQRHAQQRKRPQQPGVVLLPM